jgi:hypothetical protein
MKNAALIAFILTVFSIQATADILAGTGQAVSGDPNVSQMAQEAAQEAKTAYGDDTPKVVLFFQNAGDGGQVVSEIKNVFGDDIPVAGMWIKWSDYTPHTIKAIPESDQEKSIAVMALGGSDIDIQIATGDADFGSNDNDEALTGGRNLANALSPDENKNNLILLMGPLHTPLNEHVVQGIKEVMGDPLPQSVKLTGWGGSNWGAEIYDNNSFSGGVLGVMISGNFNWAFRGIDHGENGWPEDNAVQAISGTIQDLVEELGENPDATFFVLGHPGRDRFGEIRSSVAEILGDGHPLIGTHAGSETGHDATDGDAIGDAAHYFVTGIKAIDSIIDPIDTVPDPDTSDTTATDTTDTNTTFIEWDINNAKGFSLHKLDHGIQFRVNLQNPGNVTIHIHDILGRKIWDYKAEHLNQGRHDILWEFPHKNMQSERLSGNGVFTVTCKLGKNVMIRRLVILP